MDTLKLTAKAYCISTFSVGTLFLLYLRSGTTQQNWNMQKTNPNIDAILSLLLFLLLIGFCTNLNPLYPYSPFIVVLQYVQKQKLKIAQYN